MKTEEVEKKIVTLESEIDGLKVCLASTVHLLKQKTDEIWAFMPRESKVQKMLADKKKSTPTASVPDKEES